ncbi:MAG: hypothetical protein LBT70_04820 [Holosporaceae bacterium]|jgi:hypothetical protein|nr:hypothetical protein [Holosporaceae bacterium]
MKKECIAVMLAIGILGNASATTPGSGTDPNTADTAASSLSYSDMQNSMAEVIKELDEYQKAIEKLKTANVDLSSEKLAHYFHTKQKADPSPESLSSPLGTPEEKRIEIIDSLCADKDDNVKKTLQNALEIREKLQKTYDIDPYFIYTDNTAWSTEWKDFCQCVVRVNSMKENNGKYLPYIGTGTVINLNIPQLEGRVVITAAHVVSDNLLLNNTCFNCKEGLLEFKKEKTYLSVTPEITEKDLLMVNMPEEYLKDEHLKVKQVYIYRNAAGVVQDTAVLILEKPVLNADRKPLAGVDITNNLLIRNGNFSNHNRYWIGYGLTGCMHIKEDKIGSLEEAVKNNLLEARQNLHRRLGFNKKKLVYMSKTEYDMLILSRLGGGFSGSLTVDVDDNGERKFTGHPYFTNFIPETKEFLISLKKDLEFFLKFGGLE